jgi:hypothetical protein
MYLTLQNSINEELLAHKFLVINALLVLYIIKVRSKVFPWVNIQLNPSLL